MNYWDNRTFRYRPEIDGLRALAVLAVVLFHARFGSPGGYVGVDVFFVISGYLITSLIWADLEKGSFSLLGKAVAPNHSGPGNRHPGHLAAGYFILLPSDYTKLGKAAAQAFSWLSCSTGAPPGILRAAL